MRNQNKKSHAFLVFVFLFFVGLSSRTNAAEKQEVVNAITKAAHAYWEQRIVIGHPQDGTLYGYSGAQTLVDETDPNDRYYNAIWAWAPEPHILGEVEHYAGHPSVGFAFIRTYEATGDKFAMRAAKELGDTLISAQKDLDVGGWWKNMGVLGYDRRVGSPTFGTIVNFGKWMNLEGWGGHANVEITTLDGLEYNTQDIASFDSCSFLHAYFLLRLYQALPEGDPDRTKYLQGAKWLADEIVGLKDVVDSTDPNNPFYPYGNGGIPQHFPYNVQRERHGYDQDASYPYEIPSNLMITLNDDAMPGALFFLIEFWKEAKNNSGLNEQMYLDAIHLNVDYLMNAFDLVANENNRSAWASFYWVNDGSDRANKPTWGRAYEPPGIGFAYELGGDVLLLWHQYETDVMRKIRIENTLRNFLLYFKYDAPPLNSRPEWRDIIRPYIIGSQYIDNYDPNNIITWYWWVWYNYDENVAPRDVFIASEDVYHAYYAEEALIQENNPDDHYPMMRNTVAFKIYHSLDTQDELYLFDENNPNHNIYLTQYYGLDPEIRMFKGWRDTILRLDAALTLFDANDGFFKVNGQLRSIVRDGKTYYYVEDFLFQTRMRHLAWGAENGTGTLTDSDGDGYTDVTETLAGTDIYDSEYHPDNPAPSDQIAPGVPQSLNGEAISASQIDLNWDASPDNLRTSGYKIYRDDTWITTVFRPAFSDSGLTSNTEYAYSISAIDIAGNESDQSVPLSVQTLGFIYGDVNGTGEVTATDAAMAARYAIGLISLTPTQITAADVTGTYGVTATDAAWIARKAVGLIDTFPVEE